MFVVQMQYLHTSNQNKWKGYKYIHNKYLTLDIFLIADVELGRKYLDKD